MPTFKLKFVFDVSIKVVVVVVVVVKMKIAWNKLNKLRGYLDPSLLLIPSFT